MNFQPAQRGNIRPLIGMCGKSGGGKTMSALLFARGFVGPKGRVGLIDTENGRGRMFADVPEIGGYLYAQLDEPFSPSRYVEAITYAEQNCDILVIDSASHCWNGPGGVLEMQEMELQRMAGQDWKKREACKMAAWIKPKMDASKLVQKIVRAKIPIIACLRGKAKTKITKGEEGQRTKVEKEEKLSAVMDSEFVFELLVLLEINADEDGEGGFATLRKIGPPSSRAFLPQSGEQIGIKHGELLAQWCAAPNATPASPPATIKKTTANPAKAKLWLITKEIHGGDTGKLEAWLKRQKIIRDEIRLADIPESDWAAIMDKAEIAISDIVP